MACLCSAGTNTKKIACWKCFSSYMYGFCAGNFIHSFWKPIRDRECKLSRVSIVSQKFIGNTNNVKLVIICWFFFLLLSNHLNESTIVTLIALFLVFSLPFKMFNFFGFSLFSSIALLILIYILLFSSSEHYNWDAEGANYAQNENWLKLQTQKKLLKTIQKIFQKKKTASPRSKESNQSRHRIFFSFRFLFRLVLSIVLWAKDHKKFHGMDMTNS